MPMRSCRGRKLRSEYPLARTCNAPSSPSQMKCAVFIHHSKVPSGISGMLLRYHSRSRSKVRSGTPAAWSATTHSEQCHGPRSSGHGMRQSEYHNLAHFLHRCWGYSSPTVLPHTPYYAHKVQHGSWLLRDGLHSTAAPGADGVPHPLSPIKGAGPGT